MLLLLLALAEEFKWCPASLQQFCCWLHENNSARSLLTISAIVINFGLASTDIVSIAETAFLFSKIERTTKPALSTYSFFSCRDVLCSYGAFLTTPPGRLKRSAAQAPPHVRWPSAHTPRSAFILWPQMNNTNNQSLQMLNFYCCLFCPVLCAEWCHCHGDLRRLPAPKFLAEAGSVAAGCGHILLPHPPGILSPCTPRRAAQVGAHSCLFVFQRLYTVKLLPCSLGQHKRCSLETHDFNITLFCPNRDITRHRKFALNQWGAVTAITGIFCSSSYNLITHHYLLSFSSCFPSLSPTGGFQGPPTSPISLFQHRTKTISN